MASKLRALAQIVGGPELGREIREEDFQRDVLDFKKGEAEFARLDKRLQRKLAIAEAFLKNPDVSDEDKAKVFQSIRADIPGLPDISFERQDAALELTAEDQDQFDFLSGLVRDPTASPETRQSAADSLQGFLTTRDPAVLRTMPVGVTDIRQSRQESQGTKEERWVDELAGLQSRPEEQLSTLEKNRKRLLEGRLSPKGTVVTTTTNPDGSTTTTYSQGGLEVIQAGNVNLDKISARKVTEDLINIDEQLATLRVLQDAFDPEFLTLPHQLAVGGLSMAEKLGFKLGDKEKQKIREYTRFNVTGFKLLNKTIKDITGAAMSENEAKRIRKQEVDVENDGPTEFKEKMDESIRLARLARWRAAERLRVGIPLSAEESHPEFESLDAFDDRMERMIGENLAEIQALNPGMDRTEALERAFKETLRELGVPQ